MKDVTRAAGAGRPLTPDDLLSLEELGAAVLSPDGRWLAYVLKRPRSTVSFHKHDFLDGGDRADVWLVEVDGGGEPQNLTQGAGDGSGHWAPCWSPDSERLSMLSTRGDNVHPWTCEISSSAVTRLSARAVDLEWTSTHSAWVSGHKLLIATLPEGERPQQMTVEVQAAQAAIRAWPQAWEGRVCTGSVLDSGVVEAFDKRPQGALVLVDIATGEEQIVMRGRFRGLRLAPGGDHVAFFRQIDVTRPLPGRRLERVDLPGRYSLGVIAPDGAVITEAVEDIVDPIVDSLRWAPDGKEVALIGSADASPDASRRVFRHRVADGRTEPVTPTSLEPQAVTWAAGCRILVLARPASDGAEDVAGRADWWLVGEDEEPVKLTGGLSVVPVQLVPEAGRRSFVALADGEVIRLLVDDRRWVDVTAGLTACVRLLLWPGTSASDDVAVSQLVVAGDAGWHALDLRTGDVARLTCPSRSGQLADFAPERSVAVTMAVDRSGARLWISRHPFTHHRTVVAANPWLGDVAEGQIRRVDYRGLDGSALKGWLILPVDQEEGRRCPLITEVYPGSVYARATPPTGMLLLPGHHALSPQLLAARGYAVLFPSMPLPDEHQASDPYRELSTGVLPAIDEVIAMGIADPDRLGLIGQSYGGYGTYGLITQTHRFKAAVALAGVADLASLYGQFDARLRYGAHPHETQLQMRLAESGQLRMGGAPWQDAERYVRNSPLFHAGDVDTPLLIIQGDMDYVGLQQGEQFFSALHRQAKRARFVRYWGEGHVLQSPANIRDMWEQIYAWFGEFLKPAVVPDDEQLQLGEGGAS